MRVNRILQEIVEYIRGEITVPIMGGNSYIKGKIDAYNIVLSGIEDKAHGRDKMRGTARMDKLVREAGFEWEDFSLYTFRKEGQKVNEDDVGVRAVYKILHYVDCSEKRTRTDNAYFALKELLKEIKEEDIHGL